MPKRRHHGDGALYHLKDRNLWRGVIDDGFKPDGSRKQRYVYARTQTEARRKLEALKSEIAQYGAPLDRTTTVAAWAEDWLANVCRPRLKPSTLHAYESLTRKWIVPTIGRKQIAQVKPSDLRAISRAVTDGGRSSSTALKVHNIASAMLESARLDGMIGRNVARDVVAPRAAISTRGALATDDALVVVETAARHLDGIRWWMAILTGMRQGERLGATLDSIDFEQNRFTVLWSLTEATFEHGCGGTCTVKRGGSCPQRRLKVAPDLEYRQLDGRLCLVRPKSGHTRTFPLIPELAEALRRYLAATAHIPNPHGLIWRNPDGSPITGRQDSAEWRAILLEAGVITAEQAKVQQDRAPGTPDTPTTHSARHTTATVLMELGVDAKIIGEIIGHGTERITRRYQHPTTQAAQAAMEAIGGRFARALEAPA